MTNGPLDAILTQQMKNRDSNDALAAVMAIAADLAVIWLGQMAAVWIRFDSGLLPLYAVREEALYAKYALAAAVVLPIYLLVFQILKLYSRPQDGTFSSKVPRIVRACVISVLIVLDLSALLKNVIPYSNAAVLVSAATVTLLILLQRAVMFQFEIVMARRAAARHNALIVGAGEDAVRVIAALRSEPRLRTQASGVLKLKDEKPHPELPPDMIAGNFDDLEQAVQRLDIEQVIVTGHGLTHDQMIAIVVFCERHLIRFSMVPDLFRILSSGMDFNMVKDMPLLSVGRWPLDQVWRRVAKRCLDVGGALVGLILSAPFILVAAIMIKRESEGPIFYIQERCGLKGAVFPLYKLRTMRSDAESGQPGWTVADDPRRTKVGAWLRKYNIDELPQFWNVLRGDMSLVGPRPERPYFVDQFAPDIAHYMWRHISKPGLTGWAQVNGLRGDTSISERVKYDLYYLENWSLAFDFKILLRTLLAFKNAV